MTDISDGYDNTISGLLRKRGELFDEAEKLRDRIAEIKNDIDALDRTLASLGFKGDLDAQMPRQKREVIFGQGELTRALMRELRDADGPMTSRELANNVLALRGDDVRDRRLLTEVTKRVSKALRHQREEGYVRSSTDRLGNMMWSRRIGRTEAADMPSDPGPSHSRPSSPKSREAHPRVMEKQGGASELTPSLPAVVPIGSRQ